MIYVFLCSPTGKLTQTQDFNLLMESLEKKEEKIWVDVQDPSEEERELLSQVFHFSPQALQDVREIVGIPKLELYDEYAFLVLHRIFYDFDSQSCERREFEVFLSDQFIVTTHGKHLSRTFAATREKVRERPRQLLGRGTSFVLLTLLDFFIKDYLPAFEEWEDRLDEIEEQVLKGAQIEVLDQFLQFKKLISQMRKNLIPQRDVMRLLAETKDHPALAHTSRNGFKTILENMSLLLHELDSLKEHNSSIFEIYVATLTLKTNEASHQLNLVIQRLTLGATIFMPLTFIVGIYGMNFKYMPELEWKGSYFLLWGLMIALTIGMILYFKKRKWI